MLLIEIIEPTWDLIFLQSIDSTEFSLDESLNEDLFNQIYEKVMAAESDQGSFLRNDVDASGQLIWSSQFIYNYHKFHCNISLKWT